MKIKIIAKARKNQEPWSTNQMGPLFGCPFAFDKRLDTSTLRERKSVCGKASEE